MGLQQLTVMMCVGAAMSTLAMGSLAGAQVRGDFDGDGFGDLAIGVPSEDVDGNQNAGAVMIIYGSNSRLQASGDQFWTQSSAGVKGEPESAGFFGRALACGDFDDDGFCDLAIGAPGADASAGTVFDAGAVHVLYGSSSGLQAGNDDRWTQNSTGIDDDAEADDNFGSVLIAGDFDGDGRDDLAIGAPNEDFDGMFDAGLVQILFGSDSGLRPNGQVSITQNTDDIDGDAESGENFGATLAAGDFDGDGRDDLAIGVLNDMVDGGNSGAVNVLYGTSGGLDLVDDQLWHQNVGTITDDAEPGDEFGAALAVGDFDGDGRDDLAVGVPGENLGDLDNAGAVQVLYGSGQGLRDNDNQFWSQDSTDLNDVAEFNDQFGFALAAGDFNDNGRDDLAIGVPLEDIGGIANAGVVHVLYGHSTGLRVNSDQVWHQDQPGMLDAAEENDFFGAVLTAGDFDDDGEMDLAISVPLEDNSAVADAGMVQVMYGSKNERLNPAGDQVWHQDIGGIADTLEFGDTIGFALGR